MTKFKAQITLILFLTVIGFRHSHAEDKKIALLYSQRMVLLPTENATWLNDNFYRWELFLIQNKYSYEIIQDADLEEELSDEFSLLILPSIKCLSKNEISSIKEFMNEGNSVLATSSIGVLNTDGVWRGWDNFEQLFGVIFVSEISQKETSKIHSLFGGTPISPGIPPGFRLQITTYDKPIEARVITENAHPLGYWLDSENPFEGKEENERATSIVYGNYGRGNFVWFGFEFSAVVGAKEHQEVANQLLRNAIHWLKNDFIVQLETWPNGKQGAAVLSCDVEFKFNFVNNALDLLEQESLPAQFYILTESIDLPSFERLSKLGSVGFHGDGHTLFKWQDYITQLHRLSDGIDVLKKLIDKRPISFRPPETFYDNVTLDAMNASNVNVLSADFIEDRAVPQFLETHPNLLVIPKTGFDDYDIFQRMKIENVNAQSQKYILDFKRTYEEGGLYSLNFHTQMQCRKEFINALVKPIQEMKSRDVWITTHDRVYEWWMKKNKLKLNSMIVGERKYLVEIENSGEEFIDEVTLSFSKKNFNELNEVKFILDGKNLDYVTDFAMQKIKVNIPRIYPQEIKKLNINF